ncbi:GDSL-like Lipase/Acylhydrolase family protein [Actinokineospora terrae]|uniref:GDSL-like Lipase/Acylhydrolase family protein n=2 Tax=Actinokineospora terrae TaxID=155974 RepID=A0A1H9N4A3_9PSEU|nr:GDSL-type esterase/lipase family protein [Actinokineospora terrae]SER30243.1 GDSL-like Lipase/Acylhydrolase family protein [Actinokineospora terrae]
MMRRYRWHAAVLLLVLVLASAVVIVLPGPAPAPSPPSGVPRVLVAMGDSTVSGEAAGDYEPGTDGTGGDWCHRSRAASIHHTGLRGIDETINLACSGAPSAQVGLGSTEQYTEGSQAARLGSLARQKRVVAILVAVGANDDPSFSHVLDSCVQAWLDQSKQSCSDSVGGEWQQRVDRMVPKVVRALADIRSVMSDAGYQPTDYHLVLQSYAAPISPDVRQGLRNLNGCPFREADLRWVRAEAVPKITDGVRQAARESGARLLDVSRAGVGREACSRDDATQEWFSRLSVRWNDLGDDDRASHALQESFHPNAAGHAQLGRCFGEFLVTDSRAAACLPGADGDLHPATTIGP